MKISKKLKNNIVESVSNEVRLIANAIDKEYRNGSIPHDVWERLHLLACQKMTTAGNAAVSKIELY